MPLIGRLVLFWRYFFSNILYCNCNRHHVFSLKKHSRYAFTVCITYRWISKLRVRGMFASTASTVRDPRTGRAHAACTGWGPQRYQEDGYSLLARQQLWSSRSLFRYLGWVYGGQGRKKSHSFKQISITTRLMARYLWTPKNGSDITSLLLHHGSLYAYDFSISRFCCRSKTIPL